MQILKKLAELKSMDKINFFKKHNWLPQSILFDFEGTLVTFEWKLQEGVSALLKEIVSAGYLNEQIQQDPTYVDIHNYVSEIFEKDQDHNFKEKIENLYDHFDADALGRWNLNKGAKRTLYKLQKDKFSIGLVTNVGSKAIIPALKKLGIEDYFKVLVTRNDVSRLKPSPDGLNIAKNKLNSSSDSILFVGDSFDDIGAAKAAGIKSCYIKGGQDIIDFKYSNQPIFVIDSLEELINK